MNEKYIVPSLMTEDDLDELNDEDILYTEWDLAEAAYFGERRGVKACIGHLKKWVGPNPAIIEAIKMLEQL